MPAFSFTLAEVRGDFETCSSIAEPSNPKLNRIVAKSGRLSRELRQEDESGIGLSEWIEFGQVPIVGELCCSEETNIFIPPNSGILPNLSAYILPKGERFLRHGSSKVSSKHLSSEDKPNGR